MLTLFDAFIRIFIIFFLMRAFIEERYFLFNTALTPIRASTEPPLSALRKLLPGTMRWDPTPWIAILMLVALRGFVFWLGTPAVGALLPALFMSLQWFVDYLAQIFVAMFLITLMVPSYEGNIIVQFVYAIVGPIADLYRSLTRRWWPVALLGMLTVLAGHAVARMLLTSVLQLIGPAIGMSLRSVGMVELAKVQLISTLTIFSVLLGAYYFVLFIRIIMSWLSPDPRNPIVSFILKITDPFLRPFRGILPTAGGIDFSPILAFILLSFLTSAYIRLLRELEFLLGI